jgi:hypothetical protein
MLLLGTTFTSINGVLNEFHETTSCISNQASELIVDSYIPMTNCLILLNSVSVACYWSSTNLGTFNSPSWRTQHSYNVNTLHSKTIICHVLVWLSTWFGFINHLYTRLVTTSTSNYSAIANLHTLQIIRAHTKPSQSAFPSHFPVTASNSGDSSSTPSFPRKRVSVTQQRLSCPLLLRIYCSATGVISRPLPSNASTRYNTIQYSVLFFFLSGDGSVETSVSFTFYKSKLWSL